MIRAFLLSVAQLGDPRVLRVFVRSAAATLALFALLGGGIWWAGRATMASAGGEWATLLALFVTALALWTGFRAVAIAVIGVFADEVVAAVEARHYPDALKSARPVRFGRAAAMGAGSVARLLAVNALMLPVYLALLLTGIGTAAAFLLVNAWLLGRDLGDMVAARHMGRSELRDWRRATRGRRFALGLADAALFVVPVVNIAAPVIGAAMATHLFHTRRR